MVFVTDSVVRLFINHVLCTYNVMFKPDYWRQNPGIKPKHNILYLLAHSQLS